jgi:hypothetical protein
MSPIFTKNITKKNNEASKVTLKLYTLEEKVKKIKKFNESESMREKLNRITRSNIFNEMRNVRKKKIDEKFCRYFFRKNFQVISKKTVHKIKVSWFALIVVATNVFVSDRLVVKRKNLKERSKRKIIWLLGVAKVLGKIKLKIKKVRRILAFQVKITQKISKNVVNIRKWVKRNRIKHAKLIADYFETFIENDLISSVMFYWKEKVIPIQILYIQRVFRFLLIQRKRLYDYLFTSWNFIEKEILQEKHAKKQKKMLKKTLFHERFTITSWVPDPVKHSIIRLKVKSILQAYLLKYNNFLQLASQDNSPTLEEFRVFVQKPPRPNIRKEFTRETFRIMIEGTLKDYETRKVAKR